MRTDDPEEQRFRVMADTCPALLWMSGTDGLCNFFNKTWLDFTGRTLQEEWGVGWSEGIHFEDFQLAMDTYIYSFNRREVFEIEYRLRRKDGEYRWLLDRGSPRYTDGKRFAGYIGSCIDISDRKMLEMKMLKKSKDALDSSRLKSEFLANVSHEIRTPLNGIIGISDLLMDTELNSTQKKYMQALRESSENLLSLVNELLDFSKIDAGKVDLRVTSFNLLRFVRKIVEFMRPRADKKGLKIIYQVSSGLPVFVSSDGRRLRQILLNLLDNAIKFTDRGTVELKVSLEEVQTDGKEAKVLFEVVDSGCGIPAHATSTLFKQFSQVDGSLARKHGGTGLGLAICKQLVDLMNGEIGVDSMLTRGSKFWFTVPLRGKRAALKLSKTRPENTASGSRVQNSDEKKKSADFSQCLPILVAEDNPVNQLVIKMQLEGMGCKTQLVTNGIEAVEAVREANFSLILMDCQMPKMDGLEATRLIRKLEAAGKGHVPIVAVTAHALEDEQERCLTAGMDQCLTKPLSAGKLAAVVQRYVHL